MGDPAYFIRRRGEECSIVKLHPDGGEEILEQGLTLVEAETLYFICIGEPVQHEPSVLKETGNRRGKCSPQQLAFKF
jgi:hypothetical protein